MMTCRMLECGERYHFNDVIHLNLYSFCMIHNNVRATSRALQNNSPTRKCTAANVQIAVMSLSPQVDAGTRAYSQA